MEVVSYTDGRFLIVHLYHFLWSVSCVCVVFSAAGSFQMLRYYSICPQCSLSVLVFESEFVVRWTGQTICSDPHLHPKGL